MPAAPLVLIVPADGLVLPAVWGREALWSSVVFRVRYCSKALSNRAVKLDSSLRAWPNSLGRRLVGDVSRLLGWGLASRVDLENCLVRPWNVVALMAGDDL